MTTLERGHDLKIWGVPFAEVANGNKSYEVRTDDRDFRVGDLLFLNEFIPDAGVNTMTGNRIVVRVKHLTRSETPSPLPKGVVVLGIEVLHVIAVQKPLAVAP